MRIVLNWRHQQGHLVREEQRVNGIHNMGGMHGFGRVEVEPGEPVFHARWESRVLGMTYQLVGFGWASERIARTIRVTRTNRVIDIRPDLGRSHPFDRPLRNPRRNQPVRLVKPEFRFAAPSG